MRCWSVPLTGGPFRGDLRCWTIVAPLVLPPSQAAAPLTRRSGNPAGRAVPGRGQGRVCHGDHPGRHRDWLLPRPAPHASRDGGQVRGGACCEGLRLQVSPRSAAGPQAQAGPQEAGRGWEAGRGADKEWQQGVAVPSRCLAALSTASARAAATRADRFTWLVHGRASDMLVPPCPALQDA